MRDDVARLLLDELLLDEVADVERLVVRAGVTLRVLWLDERWLLTRDEALFVCWLRAGVRVALREDDEVRVAAGVARVALLLVARGVAVVLRLAGVAVVLRALLELRLLVAAGVADRLLLEPTVRLFALGLVAVRVSVVARVALLRLFCVARTALLLPVFREAPFVAVARVLVRVEGVVARVLAVARLFVALARSWVLAVREAAVRTFDASVTREGRAVLRVLWFTSGRYMFTVRLLTDALPGREVLAIWRTATRLLVARWISLCFGPLT